MGGGRKMMTSKKNEKLSGFLKSCFSSTLKGQYLPSLKKKKHSKVWTSRRISRGEEGRAASLPLGAPVPEQAWLTGTHATHPGGAARAPRAYLLAFLRESKIWEFVIFF